MVHFKCSMNLDLGSNPPFAVNLFAGGAIPVASNLVLQWLPCRALGVLGSVLGMVCPVSAYRD